MSDFSVVKKAVTKQFAKVEKNSMFVVDLGRDALWDAYLESFADPVERQEHNCNCCKQFIRNFGGVVSIKNGKVTSIWEVGDVGDFNNTVKALAKVVHDAAIRGIFVSKHASLGTDHNFQQLEGGDVKKWEHFHHKLTTANVTRSHRSESSLMGDAHSTYSVFKRSLDELSIDATEIVLDLIAQNSLYRGQEFQKLLKDFLRRQKAYAKLTDDRAKSLYAWEHFKEGGKVRNSAIGTLLVDLSEHVDLERAVASFESKVAPSNYQRPKALVTKKMIENAEAELERLGLKSALARRHARRDDVPVSQVIFADRDAKAASAGDVFEQLKADVPVQAKQFSRVDEIGIGDFVANVVPTAETIEVLFEKRHASNLMNLIAPVNEGARSLFKWDNGLSWHYNGGLADSMKEKVKRAGGKVDGELRISLEWFNHDDLDLHVHEPDGSHIYFSDKRSSTSDGYLDVDMNAGGGDSRSPVENIIFTDPAQMREGSYRIQVHNFSKRENVDYGFNVQIECQGQVYDFSYDDMVKNDQFVDVAEIRYTRQGGVEIITSIDGSSSARSEEIWDIGTNQFHPVSMMMYSPNHWDNDVGNKHAFFILDGCHNDSDARGFFNEFLRPELREHRRLFEVLGSKMTVSEEGEQLAGLGFSLTQSNSLIVKVTGKFTRTLKVRF